MIIWLNGAFGAGKTTCAYELARRIPGSFVYDPENIGYFLHKNLPKELKTGDFQDIPMWRSFNFELLGYIARGYGENAVIVPMTVTNTDYYDEIIGELRRNGAEVRHFVLFASRETLEKRLGKRIERGETWAKQQIDRCINAFTHDIIDERVETDGKPISAVVEEIAERTGITLTPDTRSALRRKFDRVMTLVRVIRH